MQSQVPPRANDRFAPSRRPQFHWNNFGRGCRRPSSSELLAQLTRILAQRLTPPTAKEESDE